MKKTKRGPFFETPCTTTLWGKKPQPTHQNFFYDNLRVIQF